MNISAWLKVANTVSPVHQQALPFDTTLPGLLPDLTVLSCTQPFFPRCPEAPTPVSAVSIVGFPAVAAEHLLRTCWKAAVPSPPRPSKLFSTSPPGTPDTTSDALVLQCKGGKAFLIHRLPFPRGWQVFVK